MEKIIERIKQFGGVYIISVSYRREPYNMWNVWQFVVL